MHRLFAVFLICFLLLCVSLGFCADIPVRINEHVNKNRVTAGEHINYTIEITHPKAIKIKPPSLEGFIGDFSIRKTQTKKKDFLSRRKTYINFRLNTFVIGDNKIPPVEINYKLNSSDMWHVVRTTGIAVEVKDIDIPDAHHIKPIAGLITIFVKYKIPIIVCSAIVFILMVFGFVLLIKTVSKNKPALETALDVKYLKQIDMLKKNYLEKKIFLKEFFIKIVDVLRDYIKDRYEIPARRMATEQFLKSIIMTNEIPKADKEVIATIINRKDSVQFAKLQLHEQEVLGTADFVRDFIERTKLSA